MHYNFDEIVDRRNTGSVKWDLKKNVLPMWVADMDFRVAEPIVHALEKRVRHTVYGYTMITDACYEAEADWWDRRHHFRIVKDWILFSTGVIPSISAVIQALSEPGDKILIQTPVYNHFFDSIANNRLEFVANELKFDGNRYEIDYVDFENKASEPEVKLFLMSNPHNPVGRVWTREELLRLSEICRKHDVLVLSDEIHRDLIYKGHQHIPYASVSESALMNSVTFTSPTKTFNLAGVKISGIVVAEEEIRKKIIRVMQVNETSDPNIFGIEALIAAYREGDEWLEQLLEYLEKNRDFTLSYIQRNLPMLKALNPEGTYLIWVDCRGLGVSSKELSRKLLEEAKLWVNDGKLYGEAGEGFLRINVACPRELVEDGLKKLEAAVKRLV